VLDVFVVAVVFKVRLFVTLGVLLVLLVVLVALTVIAGTMQV